MNPITLLRARPVLAPSLRCLRCATHIHAKDQVTQDNDFGFVHARCGNRLR